MAHGSGGRRILAGACEPPASSLGDKTQLERFARRWSMDSSSITSLSWITFITSAPMTRLTRTLPHGKVDFTWTSGNARPELGMSAADPNADLQRDLASLAMLPGVSLADGHTKVQRGDDYELGVSQRFGSQGVPRLRAIRKTFRTRRSPSRRRKPGCSRATFCRIFSRTALRSIWAGSRTSGIRPR